MAQALTIDARMQRVHEHILQERGIQPTASTDEVDLPDWDVENWRNFDKWNDAPFMLVRRKAEAR